MRLSAKVSCSEQSYLLGLLALQELSVSSDLLLQTTLDIHEHLVFTVLPLHISSEVGQLGLDAANQVLDVRQLGTVTPFSVCQGAFQRAFLRANHKKVAAKCRTACRKGNGGIFQGAWVLRSANLNVPC